MEEVVIRPWGNSQGIRIPKSILQKAGLHTADTLTIETDGSTIIMKKEFKHKSLKERIAAYNGKIEIHDYNWGAPVGKEFF